VRKFLWGVTAFFGFISGINLVNTTITANGAPQQAAGAALSAAWVIVPYVICRAFDAMARPEPEKTDRQQEPLAPPSAGPGRADGDYDRNLE
jgi:hypothetical protein